MLVPTYYFKECIKAKQQELIQCEKSRDIYYFCIDSCRLLDTSQDTEQFKNCIQQYSIHKNQGELQECKRIVTFNLNNKINQCMNDCNLTK